MATTTNYSWSTPDDTALVKDGAAAIRSLGTAIDSTVFTNAGAAINKSIVDAKGDLIAATGADAVTRVAVGTNGQYLKADSTASSGISWDTLPASGGMTLIQTLAFSGASVTSSTIPGTYKHLRVYIRNYQPATDIAYFRMRFNGDSSGVYAELQTFSGTGAITSTNITIGPNNDDTVATGLSLLEIPDYANSTTWKFCNFTSLGVNATTTTNATWYNGMGVARITNAITTLTFFQTGGNLTAGEALIYGVS